MNNDELFAALSERLASIEQGQQEIIEDVLKVKIKIENDIDKKMQLLLEGQQGMNEQLAVLQQVSRNLDTLQEDMTAVKGAVTSHSDQIKMLREG